MADIWEAKDVVLSIGNQQVTGKGCHVQEFKITQQNNFATPELDNKTYQPIRRDYVEIEITMLCSPDSFFTEFFDKKYKPKIRNKKVEDCSIQELFYAIRQKIK